MTNPKSFVEEMIESVRREDGLIDIGKYDDEVLEDLLVKALTQGLKLAKEVVPEKPQIPVDSYVALVEEWDRKNFDVPFDNGFNHHHSQTLSAIDQEINKLENHER